jgi:hypothetical protein
MAFEEGGAGAGPDWSALSWGFGWATLAAAVAVICPYLFWLRWPNGNARRDQKEQRDRANRAAAAAQAEYLQAHPLAQAARKQEQAARQQAAVAAGRATRNEAAKNIGEEVAGQVRTWAVAKGQTLPAALAMAETARERAIANAIRPERTYRHVIDEFVPTLTEELRGFSEDWNLKDNWVSSVSLAAAIFTGVFASTDALAGIVADSNGAVLSVIAVAAAISAGLVGAGPIFLTIFKRRWIDDGGAAKYNTVGGVLFASFVVMLGVTGLVLSAARALGTGAVWAGAAVTVAVLMTYSCKSVPQILADGRTPKKDASATPLL